MLWVDYRNVIQRLTALVLALFVASPTCWCCAEGSQPQKPTAKRHSCCEQKAAEASADCHSTPSPKNDGKEPCPCSMSQTKRSQQPVEVAVPSPEWTLALPTFTISDETLSVPTSGHRQSTGHLHDTGPPDNRPPLYKRYLALLN